MFGYIADVANFAAMHAVESLNTILTFADQTVKAVSKAVVNGVADIVISLTVFFPGNLGAMWEPWSTDLADGFSEAALMALAMPKGDIDDGLAHIGLYGYTATAALVNRATATTAATAPAVAMENSTHKTSGNFFFPSDVLPTHSSTLA
eukprot:jgi/Undpi1/304/HiC_scaffold_1.g00300.m1